MANNGTVTIDKVRKKVTYTHELISTSYHEAGHAIYALLHDIKVPLVYVYENKKNKRIEGYCFYEFEKKRSEIEDPIVFADKINHEICAYYAGLIAEKQHFKNISGSDKFPLLLRESSSDDTSYAAGLIKQYNIVPAGRKRFYYKKKLIKETLIELREHWDAVTLVSHALFKKKKLSYHELKILLTRKTKNKELWKNKFKVVDRIFDGATNTVLV